MPHQADDSEAELTEELLLARLEDRAAALRESDRTRVLASSGALAAQTCRDLINVIMNAAGGSSYYLTSPRQRILSDVKMMKSLAFSDWSRCAQLEGRVALGFKPAPTDFFLGARTGSVVPVTHMPTAKGCQST